jgi:hypothetical protein
MKDMELRITNQMVSMVTF